MWKRDDKTSGCCCSSLSKPLWNVLFSGHHLDPCPGQSWYLACFVHWSSSRSLCSHWPLGWAALLCSFPQWTYSSAPFGGAGILVLSPLQCRFRPWSSHRHCLRELRVEWMVSWDLGSLCQEPSNLSPWVKPSPPEHKTHLPKKMSFVPSVADTDMGTKPRPILGISAHK